MDHNIKIVGIRISPGGKAVPLPLGIGVLDLGSAFLNVQLASRHIGKSHHVRVGFFQISGSGNHEQPGVFIQQHLGALAQGAGGAESGNLLPVGFPVGKLLPDLVHRALAAVAEPGRELGGAVFAKVAVFQFAVAQ